MLHITRPLAEHRDTYLDFAEEWEKNGEEITPYFVRLLHRNYNEWLAYCDELEKWETCPPKLVPSTNYFLMDGNRLLGAMNIRHELNDMLLSRGGHVGYGVRPSERGKGYATMLLVSAKEKARDMGMQRILVTCDANNTASAAVIVKNGGLLENTIEDDGVMVNRYWIVL